MTTSRNLLLAFLIVSASLPLTSQAGQVIWRTSGNGANVTSEGAPLTSSFLFALGGFENGFEPTAANVDEWITHWQTASLSVYDETAHLASGIFRYTANQSPFLTSGRGYLWGFDPTANPSEWVLLTHSTWKWPVASQLAFPVVWATNADGVTAIAGQVQAVSPHLTTTSVTGNVPVLLPEAWRESTFTEAERNDASVSDWPADPDGDGLSNLSEYGLDGDPLSFSATPFLTVTPSEGQDNSYDLTLMLNRTRLVQASLEYSYDGQFWFPEGAPNVQNLDNLASQRKVRVSTARPPNQFFTRVTCTWVDGFSP